MLPRNLTPRRLRHRWEKLHTGYYFVPALMLLIAALCAVMLLAIDQRFHDQVSAVSWLHAGNAEGARSLLSSVATSVITVAGVVFSITIATLTQASNQFGPRLLRNFMRDTGNQVVLGTFVATYVYCLLVLRAVGRADADNVPHLAVNGAVVLAILSIGLLVYFIHHTSFSLQAPEVAAIVWRDLQQAIEQAFPLSLGHDGPTPAHPTATYLQADWNEAITIEAPRAGYIQAIDEEELMETLLHHDLRCELVVRPGDFVIARNPLLRVWSKSHLPANATSTLRETFMIGGHRTDEQDLEFSIHQLSEIAVRALSLGINDPYTAMTCIDWLGDAICLIAANELNTSYRYDDHGEVRIMARVVTFPGVVSSAIDHIRQYGRDSAPVTIRLLEMIAAVALQLQHEDHRAPLRNQAEMIARQGSVFPEREDQLAVQNRFALAMERLNAPPPRSC